MLVEILVLGRNERIDDELRHRLDRQIEPALLGVFGEQRSIGRMHARHHRRLIVLQLRIVGKVFGEVPQHGGHAGHADEEHDRSSGKDPSQESEQEPHRLRPTFVRRD